MIVLDASAMVEALVSPSAPSDLLHLLATEPLAAPHLLDTEVLSTLRRLNAARRLSDAFAHSARETYFVLTIARYETASLAPGSGSCDTTALPTMRPISSSPKRSTLLW